MKTWQRFVLVNAGIFLAAWWFARSFDGSLCADRGGSWESATRICRGAGGVIDISWQFSGFATPIWIIALIALAASNFYLILSRSKIEKKESV